MGCEFRQRDSEGTGSIPDAQGTWSGGDTTQSLTERAHKLMVMVGSIADFWKVNLRVLFDLETHSSQDHSVGSVSLTVDLGEDA